jgi:hypothetical protein
VWDENAMPDPQSENGGWRGIRIEIEAPAYVSVRRLISQFQVLITESQRESTKRP